MRRLKVTAVLFFTVSLYMGQVVALQAHSLGAKNYGTLVKRSNNSSKKTHATALVMPNTNRDITPIVAYLLTTDFSNGERFKFPVALAIDGGAETDAGSSGVVSFDEFTRASVNLPYRQFFIDNVFWMLSYKGYWDGQGNFDWYDKVSDYKDLYAIYVPDNPELDSDGNPQSATQDQIDQYHEELAQIDRWDNQGFILHDAAPGKEGNRLFIDYLCDEGVDGDTSVCPQYAADFGHRGFQDWWLGTVQENWDVGFRGLFVDDVNMVFRISDGVSNDVQAINVRNNNNPMTLEEWRNDMIGFLQRIREQKFGENQDEKMHITHNAIWYARNEDEPRDPFIQRQMNLADRIVIEQGFEPDLTVDKDDFFSFHNKLDYIDWIHGLGKNYIIWDTNTNEDLRRKKFELGAYYLTRSYDAGHPEKQDILVDNSSNPVVGVWPGYRRDPGIPKGHWQEKNGLYQREFLNGIVFVNHPSDDLSKTVSVSFDDAYTNYDCQRSEFEVRPGSALLLIKHEDRCNN